MTEGRGAVLHTHKKFPFPLPTGKLESTTAFSFEIEKEK
jgi:hypothetical protein